MNWFVNLSTRTKLFLIFGFMVFFLLVVIAIAFNGLTTIRQSQDELFQQDFLSSIELVELRSDQNRTRAQVLEMMMIKDTIKQQSLEREIREKAKEIDSGLKLVSESLKGRPQESKQFEEMGSVLAEYRKTRDEQFSLIHRGMISEAEKLAANVQEDRYDRIRAIAKDLGDSAIARAKARIAQAEKKAVTLSWIFIIVSILVLVLGTGAVLLLDKLIAKPLKEITTAAGRIASGDLGVAINMNDRKDEVGGLTRAFGAMIRYFQDLAAVSGRVAGGDLVVTVKPVSDKDVLGNAFANMIENLRKINQEIRDGVNVLASSASEILSSTTEIAAGMAETATSVSETTATMEEVKQTAQVSAQKSRGVSDNSQKAALVAEQGNAAVSETLAGINQINGLMETVAESVVMLSEQTQAVGEIITVVNDLAQQSNLLAVNAAIEASKAGEQGKGFAVVAQEIKSLADQSKQATEQVRAILGDIQKATGKSVLAAEQVSKAVEGGVKQATESGESIRKLAESIRDAAQAASQIAASSQQQLAGIDQVAVAMENIKQAAQQNVSGTKQAEQAAHALNELGQKLKEVVGKYKV